MAEHTRKREREASKLPAALRDRIPGFQLLEVLGQGGMGVVYRARHISMDRIVAIKVLNRSVENPHEVRDNTKRFLREARTAGKLRHENLVSAFDVGEVKGQLYMVQEFVSGFDLEETLKDKGKFEEKEALILVKKIAGAVQHAWEHGIVHRDIKPANIMISSKGVPKLCDLGLCRDVAGERVTMTGVIAGTPAYISPEQAHGKSDLDCRSDIYSLGVVLYQLVTGVLPFTGGGAISTLMAHANQPPTPPIEKCPSLSPETNALILRLMEKERTDRPEDPNALIQEIEAILAGEKIKVAKAARPPQRKTARPADRKRATAKRSSKGPWLVAGGVVAFLALVVGIALSTGSGPNTEPSGGNNEADKGEGKTEPSGDKKVGLKPPAIDYYKRAAERMDKRDWKGAIEDLTAALKTDANNWEIHYTLGTAKMNLNQLKDAIRDFTRAIKLNDKADVAYLNRGNVRERTGDIEGAMRDYNAAISINSGYAKAYVNRSRIRQNRGDLKGAISDVKRALQFGPKDWKDRPVLEKWLREAEKQR